VNAAAIIPREPAVGAEPKKSFGVLSDDPNVIRWQAMKKGNRSPLMEVGRDQRLCVDYYCTNQERTDARYEAEKMSFRESLHLKLKRRPRIARIARMFREQFVGSVTSLVG